METTSRLIAENVARIRARAAAAAARANRHPDDVRLVAVTKYVSVDAARILVEQGCQDLAESRPQELWAKAEQIHGQSVRWHLVGHLQRNKIRRTLPFVCFVHSVDSMRLLTAIDKEAARIAKQLPVLLEVNVSGEREKHGFPPREMDAVVAQLDACRAVSVQGLMTMASRTGGPTEARKNFAELRRLRDRLAPRCPAGVRLRELSMGMSRDFEEAILEGATIIRVGSALFEGLAT